MMDKCLECGGDLEHVEGRKKKKFCDENCKGAYWYKNNKKKEPQYVQYKTFKELSDKFNAITKDKYPPNEKSEKTIETWERQNRENISEIVNKPLSGDEPEIDNSGVLNQIAAIKAEKIPKERDTSMGRKVWANDQWKRIKELQSQLR